MYYSSESSDNEGIQEDVGLDFSYLLIDSETMSLHLKNSIYEQIDIKLQSQKGLHSNTSNIKSNNFLCDDDNIARPMTGIEESESHFGIASAKSANKIVYDTLTEKLYLQHNLMLTLPYEVTLFLNLKHLDLSSNNLTHINEFLPSLVNLRTLYLKNNGLSDVGLPKDLTSLNKLKELNLSGNKMTLIPPQIYQLVSLKYLYVGNNEITEISSDIKNLQNLKVLQLGGNQLDKVPDELGQLFNLGVLALCDNKLRRLPRAISKLTCLRSLLLHKNNLCCLPVEIVKLSGLNEISLRDNPLVNRFVNCCVKEIMYTPPSLLELAARSIKLMDVKYGKGDLPTVLHEYVNSGQKCVNPKCKGVYFTSCVEHIKFVDFCGKYRVPLMHYLCSSRCSSTTPAFYKSRLDSESDEEELDPNMKKVLLG